MESVVLTRYRNDHSIQGAVSTNLASGNDVWAVCRDKPWATAMQMALVERSDRAAVGVVDAGAKRR